MFPLGSVLFPCMPLQLRVFEERYLVMLSKILGDEPAEFGVVLIERGQEVGGGEQRFTHGTVAQITQLGAQDEFVVLAAEGQRRFEVTEWLDEAPYPRAVVRELEDLVWDDSLLDLRTRAEQVVRRAIALASEFVEQRWSPDVELADDAAASVWQLAAIAPLGDLDQQRLLRADSMEQLLTDVIELASAATEALGSPWAE